MPDIRTILAAIYRWRSAQPCPHRVMTDCLILLREELESRIEAVADHNGAAGYGEPVIESIDTEDRAWLAPMLTAIRQAERLVGRPDDGAPAWLDRLIDSGEAF